MTAKICHYYVTLRCNDTCEFCTMWRGDQGIRESGDQGLLESIRRLGVKHLNITGGEPLLRDDLPEILTKAKGLGFYLSMTTNGILYPQKASALIGLVDRLYFSLDYPLAEEHDRSRGVECFHEVIKSIRLAHELGEKPIILFTLTRDSVRFLPEMMDLSDKLKAFVFLNPVYDFYGLQGFSVDSLQHIRYYFKRKNVLLDLAMLALIKSGGNNVLFPRCRAKETTLTILPDGSRVSPCYFNQNGVQGKEATCSSCMRWPYMLPSLAAGFDKYFWLNQYSEMMNQFKRRKSL